MHRMTHSHNQLTFSKPLSHVTWPSRRLPIHRRISHAVVDRVYPRDSLGVRKIHVHSSADHPLRLRLCGGFVRRRTENVQTVVVVFNNCTLEREDKGSWTERGNEMCRGERPALDCFECMQRIPFAPEYLPTTVASSSWLGVTWYRLGGLIRGYLCRDPLILDLSQRLALCEHCKIPVSFGSRQRTLRDY